MQTMPVSQRKPILLAEDNEINQRLLMLQLEKLGYAAEVVPNGRDAVTKAISGDYELVLMDCRMPEMDGFAATRAIRACERSSGQHIPIVALTANGLPQDRDACIEAGMDDYIAKPLTLAMLRETLARWIP